jgi:hypothetical protein
VSPLFDLLLIANAVTFPVALWLLGSAPTANHALIVSLPALLLFVNQAHILGSSFRLYTKPGAFQSLPFLTMGLPLAAIAVLSLSVLFVQDLGRHLWALALTWTPWHYGAQAFGISALYCHRSGCRLSPGERSLMRWACMVPFFRALLGGAREGYGFGWWVPPEVLYGSALGQTLMDGGARVLDVLTFALPVALLLLLRRRGASLPLLALITMVTNGMWFVLFGGLGAFVWSTVFHGAQYLTLLAVVYVRDQMGSPTNRHGVVHHVAVLYGVCVVGGYLLHQLWPLAYVGVGFGMVEATLMSAAILNIHHFVVDAFVWRLRGDTRYAAAVTA